MLNWLNNDALTQLLQQHPIWAVAGAFLTSFTESLAIIGAITPGVVMMSVIGFLVAISVLEGGLVYCALAVGAVLGSVVSYLFGRYCSNFLRTLTFFRKNPTLLARSEAFFQRHGGKSIFIGQFLGPLRAILPMTAGMLQMDLGAFLLVSVPSAVVWSVVYTLPGFVFGALSIELPPAMLFNFSVVVLVLLVVVWFVIWLGQFGCIFVWSKWQDGLRKLWFELRRGTWGAAGRKLVAWCQDDNNQDDFHQLARISYLILAVLALGALCWISETSVWQWWEEGFNYLLQSSRVTFFEPLMLLLSIVGSERFVLLSAGLLALHLYYRRAFYLLAHHVALFALTTIMTMLCKWCSGALRPSGILYGLSAVSFPSGHVVFSTVMIGSIYTLLVEQWPHLKRKLLAAASLLVFLIGFSRLYLGVHWLKDVLGGVLIGLIALLVTALSFRRRKVAVDLKDLTKVLVAVLAATFCFATFMYWRVARSRYFAVWPVKITSLATLAANRYPVTGDPLRAEKPLSVKKEEVMVNLPFYRTNRLGQAIEPFNLIFIGELNDLTTSLQQQGWEPEPLANGWSNLLQALFGVNLKNYRHLLPPVHQGQYLRLRMTKPTAQQGLTAIIQLWPAGVDLMDIDYPVWIGNVSYHYQQESLISGRNVRQKFKRQPYLSAIRQLQMVRSGLNKSGFTMRLLPKPARPLALAKIIDWGGQRLLILQRSGSNSYGNRK